MRSRGAGFTLLEVLVAFVIVALALVALLNGGADGLRGAGAAGRTEEAVARARSHLSGFDALSTPAAEDLQGDEGGGFHWRLHVAPLASLPVSGARQTQPGQTQTQPTTLYDVSVTISWNDGRGTSNVRLDTQRLTPVAPLLK